MKIGMNNYYQEVNQVGLDNFTPGLKMMHDVIDKITKGGEDWSMYQMYKDRFEKQFEALEMFIEEQKTKSKPKEEAKQVVHAEPKQKPYPTHKPVNPNKKPEKNKSNGGGGNNNKPSGKKKEKEFIKPKVKGKGVELISPETTFIKRYALLHNKTKTKDQVSAFLRSLQKAIVERRIRKTSKYAKEIMEIQKDLISKFKKAEKSDGGTVNFNHDEKFLNKLYKIGGGEIVMPSIRFIKSFVSLQGKEVTKHKVSNLHSRLLKAINSGLIKPTDKYYKEVRLVLNTLKNYLNEGGKSVDISERQLNGLEGVLRDCGCQELNGIDYEEPEAVKEIPKKKSEGVMSVIEARQKVFRPVPLTGEWLRLIGKMCLPTHFLIYGLGGSRKTSFALLFCQYLCSLGYRILYVASEQFDTPTFTELLNRLNIVAGENFQIVKGLDVLDPKDFDFVVLDSKDDMDIQLGHIKTLKKQYPNQSFMIISQGTKTGDFTGKGQWRNAVDVMIHAEDGVIKTGTDKNRWGGSGEFRLAP